MKRGKDAAEPIAIIGMRGRFPGANDLDQYWQNLAAGVESIEVLSPEDLRASGVPDHVAQLPGYVNASPTLDGVDQFDAEFFGFSARDAALTDPQHRLFLEAAWEALEDAGYDPAAYPGAIGVFGGCELSTYLYQLYQNIDALGYLDSMQLMVTNDKDHLCTQVSYRLNLHGPSITVQTTCSTSLVAVEVACESLQAGHCDMALAGGVTVRVPQRGGYFYSAGSILSPDGHCRPFDANAQGTIVGSGVGLVVLKLLRRALSDGDNVRAVILGYGLNNDGNDKVGYTAPSFRGQVAAVRAAHAMSGISPESIGYLEAHGTGTILGDPIEIAALTEAFRDGTDRRGFCGLGAVKSNFGHLSCAAGVAGLIKAVLAIEHGAIPPTVHYKSPNPAIDLAASPFYVTTSLRRWERNGTPYRAGVSAFGVGGTNAHVVLEEAPSCAKPSHRRSHQLFVLSARSPAALDNNATRLAHHLRLHPELDLADVAFTLQYGRRAFRHRMTMVLGSDDREEAIARLSQPDGLPATVAATERPIVFMFPGQGAQYHGMAAGLYASEPVVRRAIDHCAHVLRPELRRDLRGLLFPRPKQSKQAADVLRDTRYAQPALFTVSYALAELWQSWGIRPAAMVGHSVGEYVAAVLSGVMSVDDALAVIARRGQLIAALPSGLMLSVMSSAKDLERFVDDDISIAAINAPGYTVLSGPDAAIHRVAAALADESIPARPLHTSHAFHSSMMEPMLDEFEEVMSSVRLSAPQRPFVATLSGEWATAQVTDPRYWRDQVRSTVRFADALHALADPQGPAGKDAVYLEVGPGRTLTTFATESGRFHGDIPLCLASLPTAEQRRSDAEVIMGSLGQLWAAGAPVDWAGFHRHEPRVRVSLPSYPFERHCFWIGARPEGPHRAPREVRDPATWFYRPVWRETQPERVPADLSERRILVLDEETGLGEAVAERLRVAGAQPLVVRRGASQPNAGPNEVCLDATDTAGFYDLAAVACAGETLLAGVIDCWSAAPPGNTDLDEAGLVSLLSPLRLAAALSGQATIRPLPVLLVARGTTRVHADDTLDPVRALTVGPARVVPQELPGVRMAHIDVDDDPGTADLLVAQLATGASEPSLALRHGRIYVEAFEPMVIRSVEAPRGLPDRPVVLVTGGLGYMGMHLSEVLFHRLEARIVLIGRSHLPAPGEWAAHAEDPATPANQRELLRRLARLRTERDDVLVLNADMNDAARVRAAVDAAFDHFGRVDVVVHGAARIDPDAFAAAVDTGSAVIEAQFSPKLRGLLHLIHAFSGREPQRWVLHSSISTVLGGLGLAAYAGANAVIDALALAGGESWLSIDWDAWDNAGEAESSAIPQVVQPAEGQEVMLRLLGVDAVRRVIVATGDLTARLRDWVQHASDGVGTKAGVERHPRPDLNTPYIEPRTDTERALAEIWAAQLGLTTVGIHDRFFDLGGHSLLAVQIAAQIRDRFQMDMPVFKLFQALTVAELAVLVDQAPAQPGGEGLAASAAARATPTQGPTALSSSTVAPDAVAKEGYRAFYDGVSRQLDRTGVGEASFFLNYGYISLGESDEARFEVPPGTFNPSSVRLVFELVGTVDLAGRRVLDVGCGRGGTVAVLAERFEAQATGVDLSPEAIAFCRRTHYHPAVQFEVGDAEHLPFDDRSFDAVTNIESSHTYPNLRAFLVEVRRVLVNGGWFLYTDLLPVERWLEVRALLGPLGLHVRSERNITTNVLASCDAVAGTRAQAFGERRPDIDNFLAVPGSAVYETMHSGTWEYRILRVERST